MELKNVIKELEVLANKGYKIEIDPVCNTEGRCIDINMKLGRQPNYTSILEYV